MGSTRSSISWATIGGFAVGLVGPAVLTAVLLRTGAHERDYVFLYMGLVAVIAVFRGLWPSLVGATTSFLLVDYFFIPPFGTLTIADPQDVINLAVFFGTAGVVGGLASRGRQAIIQLQALASQLQQTNSELIRLNREQAEAAQSAIRMARMEHQVQALQQSERDRLDLLANVSHDLRTPISTILAESTASLQPARADSPDRLHTIATEARRLNALVSDMLDMARIEGHALTLDLRPVHVGDAIAAAVERLSRISPAREVHWVADEAGVDVLADWDRLGQIFDNLLANADRFAPPKTAIRVQVSSETAGYVTIRVIDPGPGVPAEFRDRLFSRFFTVPTGDSSHRGTGLGLAITRGLVEAHAGTIALEDQKTGGTSFRFTLPGAPS